MRAVSLLLVGSLIFCPGSEGAPSLRTCVRRLIGVVCLAISINGLCTLPPDPHPQKIVTEIEGSPHDEVATRFVRALDEITANRYPGAIPVPGGFQVLFSSDAMVPEILETQFERRSLFRRFFHLAPNESLPLRRLETAFRSALVVRNYKCPDGSRRTMVQSFEEAPNKAFPNDTFWFLSERAKTERPLRADEKGEDPFRIAEREFEGAKQIENWRRFNKRAEPPPVERLRYLPYYPSSKLDGSAFIFTISLTAGGIERLHWVGQVTITENSVQTRLLRPQTRRAN